MTHKMADPASIETHNLIVDFGKHQGERYTRLPVSYLKWLANTPNHRAHEIAKAELARRGTTTPTIEVSGHAIDRASLSCRKRWHETRGADEGIHAWLCRMAQEAIDKGTERNGKREYAGMQFAFEMDGSWPVLKTVMPAKRHAMTPMAYEDEKELDQLYELDGLPRD